MQAPAADPLREMLAYLRDNPSAVHSSTSELAARFNLEPAFVARVIGGLPTQDSDGRRLTAQHALTGFQRWISRAAAALDWFFGHAVLASAVFLILAWLSDAALSSLLPGKLEPSYIDRSSATILVAAAGTSLAFFMLAMLAFYKTRSTKAATITASVLYALMLYVELQKALSGRPPPNYSRAQAIGLAFAEATLVSIVGWGVAILFSIWGQWATQRNAERKWSRHDVLQRYLDFTERLSRAVDVPSAHRERAFGRFVRKHFFLVVFAVSALIYTSFIFVSRSYGMNPYSAAQPRAAPPAAYAGIAIAFTFLAWAVWATIAFLVEDVGKAILVSIALVAAYFSAMGVSHFVISPIHFSGLIFASGVVTTLMYVGIGALIGIGGQMRARSV